jgi:single-stranded-DNA-specific exonuclease
LPAWTWRASWVRCDRAAPRAAHRRARRAAAGQLRARTGRRAPAAGAACWPRAACAAADELDDGLQHLLPPDALRGAAAAGVLLADAIDARRRICIVADYDCDGATACAVALRGLVMLGADRADVGYVVPDRAVHGYGLTPPIVDLAMALRPEVLVTVDNGIASLAGVAHARARGLQVLVTDHHLPALEDGVVVLPVADVIVNPNQPDCAFASKALAGVGVMFYVLLAARAELRRRGRFDAAAQPRLDALLDLVALGTVADVVKLDANNRRLVAQGLKRIRKGRMQPGVAALFAVARREPARASGFDFGFALGRASTPRAGWPT